MSGESYSAQLKVTNKVGDPYSRNMHFSSLFRKYQYCLVPRTDIKTVDKLASTSSQEVETPFKNCPTDKPCLFFPLLSKLYMPADNCLSSCCHNKILSKSGMLVHKTRFRILAGRYFNFSGHVTLLQVL